MAARIPAPVSTSNTPANLCLYQHYPKSQLVTTVALKPQHIISSTDTTGSNNNDCPLALPLPPSVRQEPSSLPAILSKIEKFASSLKLIQDDEHRSSSFSSSSSLGTLSSIQSLNDVISAQQIFEKKRAAIVFFFVVVVQADEQVDPLLLADIHERLLEEQEELRSFLVSDSFAGDFSGLVDEFTSLSKGYEEAIKRVEHLMSQIKAVRENWNDWAETQHNMQIIMLGIENELAQLRKGGDNSEVHLQQISSELELCQERMNRLETVCNYLTANLASLQHNDATNASTIDFASELALYSNALVQLRARLVGFVFLRSSLSIHFLV
ncbi:unnamed protein product [Gongylonema pulchrum]|uniref:Nsp1_C domain-containing protein n=1 Tax=Gongylonema pulchrum TaxID=637853 RepID=A0A183E429_9BILA|nr:unnamed protein product [Gongylonema pulchrum]